MNVFCGLSTSQCPNHVDYDQGTPLWCDLLTNTHADLHYDDVIMGPMASQITSLTIVYSIVYSDADQRKHQSSASLAFVRGIHRGPGNSPHKWAVTRKMFPFDDVIMILLITLYSDQSTFRWFDTIWRLGGAVILIIQSKPKHTFKQCIGHIEQRCLK